MLIIAMDPLRNSALRCRQSARGLKQAGAFTVGSNRHRNGYLLVYI